VEQFARPGGLHRFGSFMDAVPLYRALDRFRPDVVYQQVGCALTGIAAYYARRRGATMLWRVSSDASTGPAKVAPWRLDRAAERALLDYGIRHADVILAQTRQQKVRLAEHFGRDDAIVLPNFDPYPA